MTFDHARAVADAVLFEGYALYPYRRSALKNQQRWPFGVLAPRAFEVVGEASWMQTECLVEVSGPRAAITGKLRFLRAIRRRVHAIDPHDGAREVESLDVDGQVLVAWEEGEVHEVDFVVSLAPDGRAERKAIHFAIAGDSATETVRRASGEVAAWVVRSGRPLSGVVHVEATPIDAPHRSARVRVHVENVTPWAGTTAPRDDALCAFLLGTHVLLGARDAEFLSLLDPPEWASSAAAACANVRAYPVLAGEGRSADVVLASPIILYDHPRIAPESPGEFFDATEIDELLALRTRTMTDDEKREARALDPRVLALVDRADALSCETMTRLHGTIRAITPTSVVPGSRVLLRPGARRTDAQDMFLAGKSATVRAVLRDTEDRAYVAVTIDDDPAADLHVQKNRFHYFYDDEIEVMEAAAPAAG